MKTLSELLQEKCTSAIANLFKDLTTEEQIADIAPCIQEEFGHYQCNSALKIAKILRKNPREVARAIIDKIGKDPSIAKMEIGGAGFINFTLDSAFLSQELNLVLRDKSLGAYSKKKEKIVVDFSCPNIAKEMHVGHLRSTIIGDAIAKLFEFLGDDVLRLNHVGDWGTQFGMLIAYLKKNAPDVLAGKEEASLSQLMQWYKESKALFDQDATFKKEAQKEVVNLQSGQKEAISAWQMICELSRKAFQKIYNLLDVKLIERGESFYNPFLKDMVDDLQKRGLIEISDGAKCIFLEGFKNREGEPLPYMVQKSDGGYNYDTTDLAAFRHRVSVEKADRIIIVTDAGQSLHFQLAYASAVKAGYLDPKKVRFDHVPFGLVLGAGGKKLKTREGETIRLIELLTEAIDEAAKILKERLPDVKDEELKEMSKILGIDAVKYADLSCHRQKDYQFSYERMLKFEGNTAAFLLYAYVRIIGIKRKTRADMQKVLNEHQIILKHPAEISLGLHLRRFGEVLENFARDLLPNRLADYLYALAEKFNAFFRDCRVEGVPEEGERLVLCELTAKILETGLNILGLRTLSRM